MGKKKIIIMKFLGNYLVNLQDPEKKHLKIVLKQLKRQLSRITEHRKGRFDYSYNDFLGDMRCYFDRQVNNWIKEIRR